MLTPPFSLVAYKFFIINFREMGIKQTKSTTVTLYHNFRGGTVT